MSSYNNLLEEIKSRLDIVDVISEYVPLKRAGQNWKGLCPFHSEKTPSFMVNPSKQIYHCFGCGSGGDIFTFLVKYENLSFKESVDVLSKKAGVEIQKHKKPVGGEVGKEGLLNLYRDASIFYQDNLVRHDGALSYLKNRGITSEAIRLFSLGYATEKWDSLLSHLQKKGYKAEIIKKAGLVIAGTKGYYDTFRNRIIFPIFDLRGAIIAFGGRVMDDSMPKYLNSPESPIFYKSKILYGLNLAKDAIKKEGFAIFVEGYLDVITSHMNGFPNTVAPLGTALTAEHGNLIKRFAEKAILVFDGDAAGIKAAKSGISILFESGINAKGILLPEGEDPDSFIRKQGEVSFKDLLEKPLSLVDFFTMQGGEKHFVAREALESISKIPDNILQGHYAKLLSEKLKIEEFFIREELKKIKKKPLSRGISAKGRVEKPVKQSVSRPVEELYILKLIMQREDLSKKAFDSLTEEDFEDTVTRAIFKNMLKRRGLARDELIDYNNLFSKCSEEERSLITELLFRTEFEDPEKTFKDCLIRLKSKKYQKLLLELQDRIKKAEAEKDFNLLKTLLHEKQRLLASKG